MKFSFLLMKRYFIITPFQKMQKGPKGFYVAQARANNKNGNIVKLDVFPRVLFLCITAASFSSAPCRFFNLAKQ